MVKMYMVSITKVHIYLQHQISMSVNWIWIIVQLMPLVLTLREVMNVTAILDSLEMAEHAVSDYII